MAENNNKIEAIEALQQYRKLLIEIGKTEQWQCDRALLSLSGGAIGISFAFIEKIVKLKEANWIELLLSSWFFWTLTIVFVICSLFSNIRTHKEIIDEIDDSIRNSNDIDKLFDPKWIKKNYKCTTILNWGSLITFFFGILLIGLFIIKNIGGTP